MNGQKKAKRVGLVGMIVLAVVALGLVCVQGVALGVDDIPTGANVTATNTPPVIECKWELPDMDSTMSGIQYDTQDATPEWMHMHDDDMAMGPTPMYPCSGIPPVMADGATNMVQVNPNPKDLPEERKIQLWMAVDHATGLTAIDDVYWDVYHPDGTKKVQVHGVRVPVADCGTLGNSTSDGTMFEAAYHTGQIAADSIDDLTLGGLVAKCHQNVKAIYYAEFDLSKHQPCGTYKIEAHAVSGGAEDMLVNYLDVLCLYYLEIDFGAIDWGDIAPGQTDVLSGDLSMGTADAPTVHNGGNVGMEVGVNFGPMDNGNGKIIDSFDACFGKVPDQTLLCIDPFAVDTDVWFGELEPQVLCSNDLGKLDLSIHPSITLPAGSYTGLVDVLARMSDCTCGTDQRDICEGITWPVTPTP